MSYDLVSMPRKVAVLMGGVGSERDVSLQSGKNVGRILKSEGFDVVCADVTPDNLEILDDTSIEMFFLALHGQWGEDGQIQQILESKSLLFTGSGSKASRLAFDKIKANELFLENGIRVPKSHEVSQGTNFDELVQQLNNEKGKFVVKPPLQGSSLGVEIRVGSLAAVRSAIDCMEKYGSAMIEDFLSGPEFTVGIVGDEVLPIIEIRSKMGFYDYTAKYLSDETEYLFDTINDVILAREMQEIALKCFDVIGAKDLARVDFMLDENGDCYVLEINTIPGFTSHSLLPKAAHHKGLSEGELCRCIIRSAYQI